MKNIKIRYKRKEGQPDETSRYFGETQRTFKDGVWNLIREDWARTLVNDSSFEFDGLDIKSTKPTKKQKKVKKSRSFIKSKLD